MKPECTCCEVHYAGRRIPANPLRTHTDICFGCMTELIGDRCALEQFLRMLTMVLLGDLYWAFVVKMMMDNLYSETGILSKEHSASSFARCDCTSRLLCDS